MILLLAPISSARACPEAVTSQLGVRDFTTTVHGSKAGNGVGVNGYYRMIVTERACALQATIIKLGFGNVRFAKDKRQSGTFPATVTLTKGPAERYALAVDAELTSESGTRLSLGFTFLGSMGFWRYLGDSWDSVGFWGSLASVPVASINDDKYQAPDKPKCSGKVLSSGQQTIAGLFVCSEVVLASPDLRRVLWFHPLQAYGAEGIDNFSRLVDSGVQGTSAYAAFCTVRDCDREGCGAGEKGIEYILVQGPIATQAVAPDALKKKCGIQLRAPSNNGRWDGTIK